MTGLNQLLNIIPSQQHLPQQNTPTPLMIATRQGLSLVQLRPYVKQDVVKHEKQIPSIIRERVEFAEQLGEPSSTGGSLHSLLHAGSGNYVSS